MMTVLKHLTPTSSFKRFFMIKKYNNKNIKYTPTLLNIASHNTRSLLDPHKQQLLVDIYSINHFDIIALQETNFTAPLQHFPLKSICNNLFLPFFSTDPESRRSGFGVGFLVRKHLADHIFFHSSFFNRIFHIDFQFKNKNKLRIINVYLSCSDEPLRLKTIGQMRILIEEAIRNDFYVIILGDFNTDPSRSHNPSHSTRFMDYIMNNNFINTYDFVKSTRNVKDLHTYVCGSSRSTIDHVFIAPSLIPDFNDHQIISVDSTLSDHYIVSVSLTLISINLSFNKTSMVKKLVFMYQDMTNEDWSSFSDAVDARCKKSRLSSVNLDNICNIHKLNFTWDLLQKAIIDAALKIIPNKYTSHHTRNLRPKLLKLIYKRIKLLHKLEQISKKCLNNGLYDSKWSTLFDKISLFSNDYDIPLPTFTSPTLSSISTTLSCLKDLKKILIATAKIQELDYKSKSIQEAIDRRCDNFTSNQSAMFDSLLDRSRTVIQLDRCINNHSPSKELLTDPIDVKRETARHFQQVVGSRHSNPSLPDLWKDEYEPLTDINPNIYDSLMQPPTDEEWADILKSLPDGKAPDPSKISNEMLKHLGPFAFKCF